MWLTVAQCRKKNKLCKNKPIVASQKHSMLTSRATFAPISTAHSMSRVRRITFDIKPVLSVVVAVTSRPYTHRCTCKQTDKHQLRQTDMHSDRDSEQSAGQNSTAKHYFWTVLTRTTTKGISVHLRLWHKDVINDIFVASLHQCSQCNLTIVTLHWLHCTSTHTHTFTYR